MRACGCGKSYPQAESPAHRPAESVRPDNRFDTVTQPIAGCGILYEIFAAIGFLSATISYSIGRNILETEYGAAARIGAIGVGFSLELLNGVAVTTAGILLFLRLRQYDKTIATGYLLSRIIEVLLLSAGGLMVLTGTNKALRMHAFFFQLAMVILGISSASFYIFLMKWSVGPRWLFLFGVAGYLSLAFYAGMNLLRILFQFYRQHRPACVRVIHLT